MQNFHSNRLAAFTGTPAAKFVELFSPYIQEIYFSLSFLLTLLRNSGEKPR